MANLIQLLQRIEQGKTVNYERLVKLLPKGLQADHRFIFAPAKVGPRVYQVKVLDQQQFVQLLEQSATAVNRTEAALAGDSHQVATSQGLILVFHQGLEHQRPDVVVTHQQGFDQGFKAKKNLLIIENLECFLAYQQLLPLFSRFYHQTIDLDHWDIAYGAGNQINKGLNLSWFEQYHKLLCAFDYDLGGLRMFSSLKQRVKAQSQWLDPDDIKAWEIYFKKTPDNEAQLLEALSLADKLGLTELATLFKHKRRFLEQEVFLSASGSISK